MVPAIKSLAEFKQQKRALRWAPSSASRCRNEVTGSSTEAASGVGKVRTATQGSATMV
jgi:hypothetical protein